MHRQTVIYSPRDRTLRILKADCISFPECLLIVALEMLLVAVGAVLIIQDCSNWVLFSFGISMMAGGLLFTVFTIILILCRDKPALRIQKQPPEAQRESWSSSDSPESSVTASTFL